MMPVTRSLVMPLSRPEIIDPLRYREDEHHRDDGHWSESLEGEWHNSFNFWPYGQETFGLLSIRQGTPQFVSFLAAH